MLCFGRACFNPLVVVLVTPTFKLVIQVVPVVARVVTDVTMCRETRTSFYLPILAALTGTIFPAYKRGRCMREVFRTFHVSLTHRLASALTRRILFLPTKSGIPMIQFALSPVGPSLFAVALLWIFGLALMIPSLIVVGRLTLTIPFPNTTMEMPTLLPRKRIVLLRPLPPNLTRLHALPLTK